MFFFGKYQGFLRTTILSLDEKCNAEINWGQSDRPHTIFGYVNDGKYMVCSGFIGYILKGIFKNHYKLEDFLF